MKTNSLENTKQKVQKAALIIGTGAGLYCLGRATFEYGKILGASNTLTNLTKESLEIMNAAGETWKFVATQIVE